MKDKREYFQVGDKVKLLYHNSYFGKIGTVVKVTKARTYVKFEDGRTISWMRVSSLEVVKPVWSVT